MIETDVLNFIQSFQLGEVFGRLSLAQLIGLVVVAGFSQAVGHSGALFINKVNPPRFVLSLFSATLLYLARISMWLGLIWVAVYVVEPVPLEALTKALFFSRLPQLFAFLVFIPVIGIFQAWIISLAGLALATLGLAQVSTLPLWQSAVVVVLSWSIVSLLRYIASTKLLHVREAFFARIAGRTAFKENPSVYDLLPELIVSERLP